MPSAQTAGPCAVHTVSGIKDSAGGVARSVPGLCEALARCGAKTILVSQRTTNAPQYAPRLPSPQLVDTRLYDGYDWERLRVSFSPGLGRFLAKICIEASPCVLHDHGLWLHSNHIAAVVASRTGTKRVVSPRGMLEEWSLEYRRWKKAIAWRLYQRRDLHMASAFCATSVREAEALRALGLSQPIAIIPNGIDLPEALANDTVRKGDRVVLFMSRIHPKKGLLDLIEAWRQCQPRGWRLTIAGPDEGGHRREVEAAARQSGLGEQIAFVGPVEGPAKRDLLAGADIFVLPTYSENFGIVVGEALAYGIPVITTRAAPWEALQSERCGWWIDTGAASLAAAFKEAMALTDAQRREMGVRARYLVEAKYSWDSVAKQHVELYDWLLSRGDRPAWLVA